MERVRASPSGLGGARTGRRRAARRRCADATMCSWLWRRRHNPRGVSSLASATSAWRWALCSSGELVLQAGQLHLAVGQECLTHDDGQQRRHHHANGNDGEEPSPTRSGAAPSNAAPGASRDDPERGAPGRRSFCAAPSAARNRARRRRDSVSTRRCRRCGRRRHQSDPAADSVQARSARWPAGERSPTAGWRRPRPPTPCGRPGRRAGGAPPRHRRRAGQAGRRTRPMAASAKTCFVSRSSPEW